MAGVARTLGIVTVLSVLAACRGREKIEGEGPYGDRVAAAIPKIEAATGLKYKTPPRLETRSKDQVRTFLENQFTAPHVTRELEGMEVAYKRFGLLPDTLDLRKLLLDLLTEQIVGYYDPATKVLYVVDNAADELVGITITHELVHALQDQHLNLDSIQKVTGENDRATAAQAVIEGQAVFEQMSIMLGGNLIAGLPGGWDRVREMIREQSSAMPKFATAPVILQETVIFPYLAGAEFVRAYKAARKDGSLLSNLPTSTEQVLNPDRFLAERRDEPVRLVLPAPRGATEVYQNTLGAFESRLLLYEYLRDEPAAVRGASGWGGDRYQVVRSDAGEGLIWVTVWDNAVEAAEFHDTMERSINRKRMPETTTTIPDGRRHIAKGRTLIVRALDILGKPGVVYMDLPAGMDASVLDLQRVTQR